jgi:hypothetical protein
VEVSASSMGVRLNGAPHQRAGEHNMEAFHLDHNVMLFQQHSKQGAIGDLTGLVDPIIRVLHSNKLPVLRLSQLNLVRIGIRALSPANITAPLNFRVLLLL